MNGLSIVIPTYNEVGNIRALLTSLTELFPQTEVLVVDDDSPDGTADEVKKLGLQRVSVLSRPKRSGMASAYLEAFAALAAKPDLKFIATMDADLSHDPRDLQKLIASLSGCEMVVGSRYLPGGVIESWAAWRRFVSYFGNIYTRLILRRPLSDWTAGFVIYENRLLRKILPDIRPREPYAFQTEMKYRAFLAGAKIREVPITFRERTSGKSKIKPAAILEALFFPWYLKFVNSKRGRAV